MNEQRTTQRRGWSSGQQPAPRPRIRPPRSPVEIACLFVTTIGLLALLATTAYWWQKLPAVIPTHFGIDGSPNAYGSKDTILILPGLLLLLTVCFAVLSHYPWAFNYPVVITPENAARQYRRARTLLAVVNAFMATLFAVIQWQIIQAALSATTSLSPFFSPTTSLSPFSSPTFIIAIIALVPLAAIALIVWWITHSD